MNLSIDIARNILEASKQRARELGSPVSIAIVDTGGHLVLFERMMSPYGWATGNICIAKACTAVMFNQSTDAVAQWGSGIPGFASSMAEMSHGKFIMAAGGWPIRIGGATIGGIGVSGGNAAGRDDEIARAGLGILEAAAPPIAAQPPQYAQPAMPVQQQQHSRPYMQPAPVYPSMPAPNNPPAPVPSMAPAPNSSVSDVEQGALAGTHYLVPEQQQEENL
ncbi:MAG TPA: heme-binding protein, partial [Ktedonobacteraceae bacterium]